MLEQASIIGFAIDTITDVAIVARTGEAPERIGAFTLRMAIVCSSSALINITAKDRTVSPACGVRSYSISRLAITSPASICVQAALALIETAMQSSVTLVNVAARVGSEIIDPTSLAGAEEASHCISACRRFACALVESRVGTLVDIQATLLCISYPACLTFTLEASDSVPAL